MEQNYCARWSQLFKAAGHSHLSFRFLEAASGVTIRGLVVAVSYLCLEVSTGRTDDGLAHSNSFWAGYGRAQLINSSIGQKTN